MLRAAYSAHEALVAPARAYPQIWRLVVGLVVAGTVAYALNLILRNALLIVAPDLLGDPDSLGNSPGALLVLLLSFGTLGIGTFVAARALQDRPVLSLIGPLPLAVRQFLRVFAALILFTLAVMILPPYDMGAELVSNLDFGMWLLLLPVSLFAILVQSASEEVLFRGYIQQTLAARFNSPLFWLVLPSLLFGLGHYLPEEAGDNAMLIAGAAMYFGLLMGDLTARAGTLGPAVALHMVNNISAILIVSVPDSLSGLALATMPTSVSDTGEMRVWLMVDFAFMTVAWLVARLAIRR